MCERLKPLLHKKINSKLNSHTKLEIICQTPRNGNKNWLSGIIINPNVMLNRNIAFRQAIFHVYQKQIERNEAFWPIGSTLKFMSINTLKVWNESNVVHFHDSFCNRQTIFFFHFIRYKCTVWTNWTNRLQHDFIIMIKV